MKLKTDSLAMLMLCSRIGFSRKSETKTFTLRDWNPLVRKLVAANMRPGDLLGLSTENIQKHAGMSLEQAERIAYLLERGTAIAIELERLESLGIWVITRADETYPEKYKNRLKESAPIVLFGAGDRHLPGDPGLAMIGSRDVSIEGKEFAEFIGNACAQTGLVVYSGGARGVDSFSMKSALQGGRGFSVGILAHSLEKVIRDSDYRRAIEKGNVTLLTPFSPNAGFNVGNAMGRNKLIYSLADFALVISSDFNKGGTWAGATENLKQGWVPLFVMDTPNMPEGNTKLLDKGAISLPNPLPIDELMHFRGFLEKEANVFQPPPSQIAMF